MESGRGSDPEDAEQHEADRARTLRRQRIVRRRRRCDARVRGLALLLTLLTIVGSLHPFEWDPPRWLANGARREGGAIRFAEPGRVDVDLDERFAAALARGEPFEIELEFHVERRAEDACLLALVPGSNASARLALSATRTCLELGRPERRRGSTPLRVEDALDVGMTSSCRIGLNPTGEMGLRREPLEFLRSDGARPSPEFSWTMQRWHSPDARALRVILGNDVYGDAPFCGTIRRAALRLGAQSVDLLASERAITPPRYWRVPESIRAQRPRSAATPTEFLVLGALWFAILVAVFGRTFARRRLASHRLRALGAGAALAALTEFGQILFGGRVFAWLDLFVAWLGCVLGLGLLALRATTRAERGELAAAAARAEPDAR